MYSVEDIACDYEVPIESLEGIEVLVGYYTYACYEGSAFVLFRKDGKLFENHGSHCSCYGLEGQWSPEETTEESIRHRLQHGNDYAFYPCAAEVRALFP